MTVADDQQPLTEDELAEIEARTGRWSTTEHDVRVILRLVADVRRLRAALEPFVDDKNWVGGGEYDGGYRDIEHARVALGLPDPFADDED